MRRPLAALGLGGVTAAALLPALTQRAGAASPGCPAGVGGTLAGLNRTVVPIGASAVRAFAVAKPVAGVTVADLVVTAPAEYGAVHVTSTKG